MKTVILLCSWCITATLSAQSGGLIISDPIVVSDSAALGSTRPRVVLTEDNIPLVMWSKTSPNGKIFVSRLEGSQFTAPVQVSPDSIDIFTSPGEGAHIAAKGNTVFITYFSLPANDSKIYIQKSTDGGVTWSSPVRADHQSGTGFPPYTPAVAIDDQGNPHLAFEISTTSMQLPSQMYCSSDDGGLSYSQEIAVSAGTPGQPCECCPPTLLLHDSLIFVSYRNNLGNIRNIYTAVSKDYGATFETVVQTDNTNWNIAGCPTAGPESMISNDSLMVVYQTRVNSLTRTYITTMNIETLETGASYPADQFYSGTATQRHPSIAGNGDTIAIAWDDNRFNTVDCFIAFSLQGTHDFQFVSLVNFDNHAGTQQTPHLAFSNGLFHIVYQDVAGNRVLYHSAAIGPLAICDCFPAPPQVIVYPNPFHDQVHFEILFIDAVQKLEILNLEGKTVRSISNPGQFITLDKNDLSAGMYVYRIIFENGHIVSGKLVVQ